MIAAATAVNFLFGQFTNDGTAAQKSAFEMPFLIRERRDIHR